jgi:diphthine-ammonia ligase
MRRLQMGGDVKVLINMMNEEGKISRSHGLPAKLLEMQAVRIGIPVLQVATGWSDYEHNFISLLQDAKRDFSVEEIVFGDIDLQAHRDWEEMVCEKAGVKASLPLWKKDRRQLVVEMLRAGIETTIVSCNETMGKEYIGRPLSLELVEELELKGIDPCGENGEFHTVVNNCPLFSTSIKLPSIQPVQHEGYWFSSFGEF